MSGVAPRPRSALRRNGTHRPQKALQQMARAKKAAAPTTNRALHQRERQQQARLEAVALAESELRQRHDERESGTGASPAQIADWGRAFARDPASWMARAPAIAPWPNQAELVPRLLHCCSTPCPDGGGRGALLREGMGRGKTLTLYTYLWEAAKQRVR